MRILELTHLLLVQLLDSCVLRVALRALWTRLRTLREEGREEGPRGGSRRRRRWRRRRRGCLRIQCARGTGKGVRESSGGVRTGREGARARFWVLCGLEEEASVYADVGSCIDKDVDAAVRGISHPLAQIVIDSAHPALFGLCMCCVAIKGTKAGKHPAPRSSIRDMSRT